MQLQRACSHFKYIGNQILREITHLPKKNLKSLLKVLTTTQERGAHPRVYIRLYKFWVRETTLEIKGIVSSPAYLIHVNLRTET